MCLNGPRWCFFQSFVIPTPTISDLSLILPQLKLETLNKSLNKIAPWCKTSMASTSELHVYDFCDKRKKKKPSVDSLLDRAICFRFTSSSCELMTKIISHWMCWMCFRFSRCLSGEPGPAVREGGSSPGALTRKRRTPWSWWSPRRGSSA